MSGIALIPARGGSKRIPRKNVRPFLGEPALARVIRTVHEAGVVDRIMVSTDDDEIARVALDAGGDVPGRRPAEISDDHTPTIEVVRHAVRNWLVTADPGSELWIIYPTALLLTSDDLRAARDRFHSTTATFLMPVLRFPHPVERRLRLSEDGLLQPQQPEHLTTRTQDLAPSFHDAGQFYVGRISDWLSSSPMQDRRTFGLEVPAHRAIDLDEPEHWARAEALARLLLDDSPAEADRNQYIDRNAQG